MSVPTIVLFVIAIATGMAALAVVVAQNIVRAAVWLLFTLIGVSLTYFLLGAEFLGASQLIIYVGGTLVLVVFGVMLTAQGPFQQLRTRLQEWLIGGIVALALFGILVYVSLELARTPGFRNPQEGPSISTGEIGSAFLNVKEASPAANLTGIPEKSEPRSRTRLGYLLPFEIISVHLLVVLIGAAYLARAKRRPTQGPPSSPSLSSNPVVPETQP